MVEGPHRSEFLVRIEVSLPSEMPEDVREELITAERRRGEELLEAGLLRHVWRTPGRHANVSIYRTSGPTQLHEVLMSLPLAPWMTITIEALADHPLMLTGTDAESEPASEPSNTD